MTKKIPKATHSGTLKIGKTEIPCYVLEDGQRILSTRGLLKSLGRTSMVSKRSEGKYPVFLESRRLEPFIPKDLAVQGTLDAKPFKTDKGSKSKGYSADLLPTICEIYLKARDADVLLPNQLHIAKKCDILIRGFAKVGIIALVDEATGYESFRSRKALEKILDEFISQELRKWSKTFPDDFYQNMFRLRGWQYKPFSVKRPSVVGRYTNDLIYSRLAPSVLDELKKKNPKDAKGRRKHKNFQWLTADVGDPRLREHLASVITLMKASSTWKKFYHLLNRALPQYDTTLLIPFVEDEKKED
jgi:hypothetical protein